MYNARWCNRSNRSNRSRSRSRSSRLCGFRTSVDLCNHQDIVSPVRLARDANGPPRKAGIGRVPRLLPPHPEHRLLPINILHDNHTPYPYMRCKLEKVYRLVGRVAGSVINQDVEWLTCILVVKYARNARAIRPAIGICTHALHRNNPLSGWVCPDDGRIRKVAAPAPHSSRWLRAANIGIRRQADLEDAQRRLANGLKNCAVQFRVIVKGTRCIAADLLHNTAQVRIIRNVDRQLDVHPILSHLFVFCVWTHLDRWAIPTPSGLRCHGRLLRTGPR